MKVTTADRLQELMEFYGITQADISRRTKIPKTTLSQYVLGKRVPKQNILTLLSETYNVSEPWLMGYDVPMENKVKFKIETDAEEHLMIIALYEELNEKNREKVVSYMKYVLHDQKGND